VVDLESAGRLTGVGRSVDWSQPLARMLLTTAKNGFSPWLQRGLWRHRMVFMLLRWWVRWSVQPIAWASNPYLTGQKN